MTTTNPPAKTRLEGIDLARFLALAGMVVVNFSIVLTDPNNTADGWSIFAENLQGRSAALFVMLAGIGLGLSAQKGTGANFITVHYKRAAILLGLGLLNMLVFEADIIHFYAFYFAFGVWCVRWSKGQLITGIFTLMLAFSIMILTLNYDAGWDWNTNIYEGFWTPEGFIRNLFFNGWHPVIPWLAFFLWGILLTRFDLYSRKTIFILAAVHGVIFIAISALSAWLVGIVAPVDAEAAYLFGTTPIPPMPFYTLAAGSLAVITIALCLFIAPVLKKIGLLGWFTRPGRQSLTLYAAHIYLGMEAMALFGWMQNQSAKTAIIASIIFCIAAIIYAWIWNKYFKIGPLEALLRNLSR
jgi:uncharacterized protein